MKRSQINRIIRATEAWVDTMHFALPAWAHWDIAQWQALCAAAPASTAAADKDAAARLSPDEIFDNMLGWDVTDYGKGDFDAFGFTLFTIRNGKLGVDKKTYAEKILVIPEGQGNPMHFHWYKMEDIINRGGGRLLIEVYGSTPEGGLSREPVSVSVDGIRNTVPAGTKIPLEPGQSICVEQGLYHRFFAQGGTILAGEVSMVNDDNTDNRFLEPMGRYATIDEDEAPYRLLCGDYRTFLNL